MNKIPLSSLPTCTPHSTAELAHEEGVIKGNNQLLAYIYIDKSRLFPSWGKGDSEEKFVVFNYVASAALSLWKGD